MLRKILSYGFVEGIGKVLNKLSLLLLPFLLFSADYGKIGLIISLEMILPYITLLGFERVITRFYSHKTDYVAFDKTISTAVIYSHVIGGLLLILLYLLGYRVFFGLQLFPDVFLIIVLVYLQGKNLFLLEKLRVIGDHKMYFKSRLFLQFSKVVLVLLAVLIFKSYIGYILGSIVAVFATNIMFLKATENTNKENEKFSRETFKVLFTFSFPFIFHGIANNFIGNADKFILERYMSLEAVGQYTFAYTIGSSVTFAFIGISIFLEPLIYKEVDEKKRIILLEKFVTLALLFGSSAYFFISILSVYVLPQFYGEKFEKSLELIPLLALSFLIYPFYLKSNYKMIYLKKSGIIASTSILSSLVNIGLNIYLIPLYGLHAAVIVTFISYAFQAFLFVLFANKFKINYECVQVLILSFILGVGVFFEVPFYFMLFPLLLFTLTIYYAKIYTR